MSKERLASQVKLLEAVKALSNELNEVGKLNEGHTTLWEVAVRAQNGQDETHQRELLHNILDQGLDIRMRVLNLTKTFLSS